MKSSLPILSALLLTLASCQNSATKVRIQSPNYTNTIQFELSEEGLPYYLVYHDETTVIDTSFLSFNFKNQPALKSNLKVVSSNSTSINETWEMPWGEQREVVNAYNELVVELEEVNIPNRRMALYFRAYDDGIGFRYEFLAQEGVDSVIIMEENTEFNLTGNHTTWWIPADWDSYEHLYSTTKVSEIKALEHENAAGLGHTSIFHNAVHTPVTMKTQEGIHLSIHEAALLDYASMTLLVDTVNLRLTSQLVGSDRLGYKVKRALPFKTPWRAVQIADEAKDLIASNLIVNLNEPNKIGDVSWFSPMKYMGIWWEMHIDVGSWDYGMTMDEKTGQWVDTGKAHGRHSATTENTKRYIDFASKNNISGLLVEGWNTGWERWIGFEDREGVFDFVTPYSDYDFDEVIRYSKEKGVEIIMHHETSAAPRTYEKQLDTAYQLMAKHGIHSVKSGYVGKIIPKGEYHHGQWMVNHYQKAVEKAAKYQVAVNAHEPIKATGLRRTYPNTISREGLRGQEFNAWAPDGGNPPEHLAIVAFTRMLAGPIDFTPGVFDILLPTKEKNQINTTLAHQLALYVVIYSPIQMACDLPQNYENQPAFQFIRDVGVDWEQSKVLDGEIGDFVVIAREEKGTGNWFVGGISDEKQRSFTLNFDFLEKDKSYLTTIYRDKDNSHYRSNPTSIEIEQIEVSKNTSLEILMKEGGGFAISMLLQK
ncbi:MAG: glycoside hydrolase family 97 protein [Saprospiraceae bacterium]|nr:glycoside hydrolase family 97 protein [Saprospiraceae bacterium]